MYAIRSGFYIAGMDTTQIPVGLATKLGALGAGIAGVIAGVTALLNGDHTETTITALLISGGLIYGVVQGRMKQAAAALGAGR